jgi:hypothetical protein
MWGFFCLSEIFNYLCNMKQSKLNMKQSKFEKVKSIIESCETYEQIGTCFSFVKNAAFFPDLLERQKVFEVIQSKEYQLKKN